MSHTNQRRIILASQSPRRVDLLGNLGLQFEVIPSEIDESTQLEDPAGVVEHLAREKAETVRKQLGSDAGDTLIIGADTIVVLGKDILGKPSSREDAYQTLIRMSGRCHKVYTGVALIDCTTGVTRTAHEVSTVYFRSLDSAEVRAYCRTNEPMDKAGSYALQGTASAFVQRIEGCYSNVIGLPVPLVVELLRSMGVRVLGLP
jgi:septum formation protein